MLLSNCNIVSVTNSFEFVYQASNEMQDLFQLPTTPLTAEGSSGANNIRVCVDSHLKVQYAIEL